MKVLLAASEATPYAKTGGLADVASALADALSLAGAEVMLAVPLYRGIRENFSLTPVAAPATIKVGSAEETAEFHGLRRKSGVQVVFIGNDGFFDRKELYSTSAGVYKDNDQRFVFFSKAVLELSRAVGFDPDILHANDWQSALAPVYMKTSYRWDFPSAASVLTIHNLGYQGLFPPASMTVTGLPYEFYTPGIMEFYGKVNFLKAGIMFADAVTTVSEQYSKEILQPRFGFGLDGVLRERSLVLSGIQNGIDQEYWDPATDSSLPEKYSASAPGGKAICRSALLKKVSFDEGPLPLAGMVGRLSDQKGVGILIKALPGLFRDGLRLVVLGRGDADLEDRLLALEREYTRNLRVRLDFDEPLAHLIYAGSDMFLMPSMYEPCGLAQMISMRYGTPPVVHATGGLLDTVTDLSEPSGTGFVFNRHSAASLARGIRRAMVAMQDSETWSALMLRCMDQDFSWTGSALKYIELYKKIKRGVQA